MSPKPDVAGAVAMRLMQVVGARPQFVKLAPVSRAIAAANAAGSPIEDFVVHTGQHYDPAMSDVFFAELGIPEADLDLGVGSGSHGRQTARMLEALEGAMLERRPDIVLTYGDTNSTLAATLAAAKLHVPVAHVEAGLRSFNRRMPEEANRLVADHLSDLLFAPTPEAMRNLANEGLAARARQVGDVMLDAIRAFAPIALERSRVLGRLGLEPGAYLVATLHRAENTPAERLAPLLAALAAVGTTARPVILPLHPRTANAMREAGLDLPRGGGLRAIEPLGYLDMIALVARARIVLTDSGGLQKEAFFLDRPCVTLREETEWVETVAGGGNRIAGTDAGRIGEAVAAWDSALARAQPDFSSAVRAAFGDGAASARIVAQIAEFTGSRARP
ncbi:MAG TPA: UDP-N-acetylglucosamine 2-epimerase (non-hydrolyzing) [Steroidobacteraceae bacterium]|nr:UDP-N-acetylglucosamine 2-epimerase (non-hydrolyzing) [Steroidobacteraceae bacterium]